MVHGLQEKGLGSVVVVVEEPDIEGFGWIGAVRRSTCQDVRKRFVFVYFLRIRSDYDHTIKQGSCELMSDIDCKTYKYT